MRAKKLNTTNYINLNETSRDLSDLQVEIKDWGIGFVPVVKDSFTTELMIKKSVDKRHLGYDSYNIHKNDIYAIVKPSKGEAFEVLMGSVVANSDNRSFWGIETTELNDILDYASKKLKDEISENSKPYLEALSKVNLKNEDQTELSTVEINYYSSILAVIKSEEHRILKEATKEQEIIMQGIRDKERGEIEAYKDEKNKKRNEKIEAFAKAITTTPFISLFKKVDEFLANRESKNNPKKQNQKNSKTNNAIR